MSFKMDTVIGVLTFHLSERRIHYKFPDREGGMFLYMTSKEDDFWYEPNAYKWTLINYLFRDMSWIKEFDARFREQLMSFMAINSMYRIPTCVVRTVDFYEEKRLKHARV